MRMQYSILTSNAPGAQSLNLDEMQTDLAVWIKRVKSKVADLVKVSVPGGIWLLYFCHITSRQSVSLSFHQRFLYFLYLCCPFTFTQTSFAMQQVFFFISVLL